MTPEPTPSATWNAKTEAEQVEWIAVEIMKWAICGTSKWYEPNTDYVRTAEATWNPLTNWNDWRSVEMKIIKEGRLMMEYYDSFSKGCDTAMDVGFRFIEAPLPKRCEALYLAYTSLHPTL